MLTLLSCHCTLHQMRCTNSSQWFNKIYIISFFNYNMFLHILMHNINKYRYFMSFFFLWQFFFQFNFYYYYFTNLQCWAWVPKNRKPSITVIKSEIKWVNKIVLKPKQKSNSKKKRTKNCVLCVCCLKKKKNLFTIGSWSESNIYTDIHSSQIFLSLLLLHVFSEYTDERDSNICLTQNAQTPHLFIHGSCHLSHKFVIKNLSFCNIVDSLDEFLFFAALLYYISIMCIS